MNKRIPYKITWYIIIIGYIIAAITGITAYCKGYFSIHAQTISSLTLTVPEQQLKNYYVTTQQALRQRIIESVSAEHMHQTVEYLSETIGIRVTGSDNEYEAAVWLESQLQDFSYQTQTQTFTLSNGLTSQNITAYQESAFTENEPLLILGAHYDSVQTSPGATDNASGVAALLEIARIFSQIDHGFNLIFIFFGAEECIDALCSHFHQGSAYYVSQLSEEQGNSIHGMINLDMVTETSRIELRRTIPLSEEFAYHMSTAFEQQSVPAVLAPSEGRSDHASFEKAFVPAVFIFAPGRAPIHTAEDVIEDIDFQEVEIITEVIVYALVEGIVYP